MRSRLLWLCTAVALLASPSAGWAQRTTGDIRGVITDESGAVLPGVTVTLRGPAVQGTPTTVLIDAQGRRRRQVFGVHDDLLLGAEIGTLLAELGAAA